MYSRALAQLALATAALVALNYPGQAQARLSKSASVTLQVVALEPSQLADGVLQLGPGQRTELELRAMDAAGTALDLSSSAIQWQASDPSVLQVKGDGPRAVVARTGGGTATLIVSALGQRVMLSAPVVAANPTMVPAAVPSQPVTTTATLALDRPLRPDLVTRDPCYGATPDPSLGQPCIRQVWPTSARYGSMVWVKGTGFSNGTAVIGGLDASWISGDTLTYAMAVPRMVDGSISVTNKSSGRRATASFTLDRTPPSLLPLDPDSGVACTQATIRGLGLLPPVQVGAVRALETEGGDTAIRFTVPRLPPGVTSGFIRVGPNLALVSTTPFRVLAPVPTASLPPGPDGRPNTAPVWAGSTTLSFYGHLREVTKVSFAGGVELTQGWTVSAAPSGTTGYHRDYCLDRLQVLVPPAAVSGPVTFTNPSGSVSVNLTIQH